MSQGAPPDFTPPQISNPPFVRPPLPYPDRTPTERILRMIRQLSNYEVAWLHGKQRVMGMTGGPKAWIYLTISSVKALGWDEERTQQSALDPTLLDFNLCGQRLITVTCRAESMEEGLHPNDMLERIRWTQRSSLGASLRQESHLAIATYGDIRHLGTQSLDNREVRVAVMDLIFGIALNAPEPGVSPTSIYTVDGGTQAPGTPFTIPGFPILDGALGTTFADDVAEIFIPIGTSPSYVSASSVPAGAYVIDAKVIITTPFTFGTTIQVGNLALSNAFMGASDSSPQTPGQYDAPQNTAWGNAAGAVLVGVLGTPVAGAGFVAVQYITPTS